MKINVGNLRMEVDKLNKLIGEYEEIYLNLYNNLLSGSVYWEDDISRSFFESVNLQKVEVSNTITEMIDIKEIYEYLVNKYEEIGNKIECFPENKNSVLSKFDAYLVKLDEVYKIYLELNLDVCPGEAKVIRKQMNKLVKIENDVKELKENIKKYYDLIEEIEKAVNLKISKISIEYIKETDISRFV